jgi:hypothetical protein
MHAACPRDNSHLEPAASSCACECTRHQIRLLRMHATSSTSSHEAASRAIGSDSAASDRASSSSANASTTNSSTAVGSPAVAGNGRPGPVRPPESESSSRGAVGAAAAAVPGPRPQTVPPAVPEQASQATTTSDIFPARHVASPSSGADASTSDHSSARPLFSSLGAEPRSARISSEPPIPADIHVMLMTTPPPPPTRQQLQQREMSALRGGLYSATAAGGRSANWSSSTTRQPEPAREDESVSKLASRMKAFRFLGGGSGGSEKSTQSSSRSRQRPGTFSDWMRPSDARPGGVGAAGLAGQQTLDSPDREKRRRTTGERKSGRMDSKTPADSVPKTWSDYALAYALGQMDVSDPPFPPVAAQQIGPSPYDVAHFPAPLDLAPTSAIRNRLIEHLDLLGRNRRFSSDTLSSSHGMPSDSRRGSRTAVGGGANAYPSSISRSLIGDTALRALLSRALYAPMGTPALFKPAPKAAMITLFPPSSEPTAPVTILASLNLPHNLSIPLSHAIDAHVLLNGERGLVVPDTERDWRWRGNDLVCSRSFTMPGSPYNPSSSDDKSLGIRFYAAMPIFAPSMPELASFEEEAGGRIAIGTIAVLDDWPRLAKFGSTERAQL